MPASADAAYAVDTSVAVPALDAAHAAHVACVEAVRTLRPALTGHAAFETHSVLTRMPGGLAVDAPTAASLLQRVFGDPVWLSPSDNTALLRRLGPVGIIGGGVYDAMVAESALTNGRTLLTRDRRAIPVYELIGAAYRFVGS
jgi:predicted nucleic acid-binding protein